MKRKNNFLTAASIFLIFVILFCSTETVMSQNKTDDRRTRQYYAAMEEEYRTNISQVLNEKGFVNSGVNIRWVSDGDGTRTYTVIIHHIRLNTLDDNVKDELLHELAELEFRDERCSFRYEFLKA
ncbi:MAG: hypothetical protein HDR12_05805 [Lachnospiraceae bacterium]|nr:hypothetical protein [Lachnospiraceae bacterium]